MKHSRMRCRPMGDEALRELMKQIASCLKSFDPKETERRATGKIRELWEKHPPSGWPRKLTCAICGYTNKDTRRIQLAHIEPIWEDGKTRPDNLIPLCSTGTIQTLSKKLSADQALSKSLDQAIRLTHIRIGCHSLFDDAGAMSREQVRQHRDKIGKKWHVREAWRAWALKRRVDLLVSPYLRTSSRKKRWKELTRTLRSLPNGVNEDRVRITCDRMQEARRSGNRNFIRQAIRDVEELERLKTKKFYKRRPALWSRFEYEKALFRDLARQTDRRRSPTLWHKQSTDRLLARSAEYARQARDWSHKAMSEAERIHYRILLSSKKLLYRSRANLDRRLRQLRSKFGTLGGIDCRRWEINVELFRAQLHCKIGLPHLAFEILKNATKLRDSRTLLLGWTSFQSVHLLTIGACIDVSLGCLHRALQRCARATALMSGCWAKRPEGVRDVIRAAEKALRALIRTLGARRVRLMSSMKNALKKLKKKRDVYDSRSGIL